MSDAADIANDRAQAELDHILQNRPRPTIDPSALECEDCLVTIPEARRQAVPGVQKCVACQATAEQQAAFQTGRFLRARTYQ